MKFLLRFDLNKNEFVLWIISVSLLMMSFIISKSSPLLLFSSIIGVTSLLFIAKGEPMGQFLMIIFSILYSVVSFEQRLYSEIITYLGMTYPSSLIALIVWLKNPYKEGKSVVKVSQLSKKNMLLLVCTTPIVGFIFYQVLVFLNTPFILISTISIVSSYIASMLMFFRSRHYAIFYAINDLVLITLWTLASHNDGRYIPMIICFVIFFIHDSYAFFNWKTINKEKQLDEIIWFD